MNPLTEFAAAVGWSANLLAVVILAGLSLFAAACLLAHAWQEGDDLIANQPPPDAPNFTEWPWADDALALGNGDDFRDWESELRGGVR